MQTSVNHVMDTDTTGVFKTSCLEARALFESRGISIADWAREHGFNAELTRMILGGKRKCVRGQSHKIAVALGLKHAQL